MHDIDKMLALQLEGDHESARALSDKLEELGPDKITDPEGNNTQDIWLRHSFNRGWFLLQEGKYQEGSQTLEAGRFLDVYGSPPLRTQAPIAPQGLDSIKGKSLIISLEGGYGDEIIHSRFASVYKRAGAEKVYLACAPELHSLLSRIEGVDGVISRDQSHTVEHDYWIPGFSAGWLAGFEFDTLPNAPYISSRPDLSEEWSDFFKPYAGKLKIGLRWAGNPKFEHQQFRKFPTAFITNLTKYSSDQVQLFSLQRDHNLIDLPDPIVDLQDLLLTWEETAAAISNLDLVITSCTSIAHLSAAMGKPTWVIVPCLPYHTWAYKTPTSTSTPYYQTARLFRQRKRGKWNDAFQQLYTALEDAYGLGHVDMPNEDKVDKKLNLGCGIQHFTGYHNVDVSPAVQPDEIVDLNVTPWPWADKEYTHVVAKDILEHLGDNTRHFLDIIKEMYRVSDNGASWEIQVPHWRCDIALDDPHHKRLITLGMLKMFDQRVLMDEKIVTRQSDSLLAFEEEIDISIADVRFIYTPQWQQKLDDGTVTQQELDDAINYQNNVALSMVVLMQVHNPPRYTKEEFETAIAKSIGR